MKNQLNVFTLGYDSWRRPHNWPHNIKNFFRTIKWAWQRATKGYCTWDLWDLDAHLIQLLPTALRDFKKDNIGHPAELTPEEWDKTIDEMIDHFEKAYLYTYSPEKYCESYDTYKATLTDINSDSHQAACDLFFKEEVKILKEGYNHLCQGMDLLKKWMPHLWW